jgi:uncharacterized protein YkwD
MKKLKTILLTLMLASIPTANSFAITTNSGIYTDTTVTDNNWIQKGKLWYHLNADGNYSRGWTQINNKWYYFEPNGVDPINAWLHTNDNIDGFSVNSKGEWTENGQPVDARIKKPSILNNCGKSEAEILYYLQNEIPAGADFTKGASDKDTIRYIVALTNLLRESQGIQPVQYSRDLSMQVSSVRAMEAKYSFDWCKKNNSLKHMRPNGTLWCTAFDPHFPYIAAQGENLSKGYNTALSIVHAWYHSDLGHKEVLLSKDKNIIGVALYNNPEDNKLYCAQNFYFLY